eukprot:GHVP01024779.1.p1 GENE.GHVP01024779.1~~GHVP01024779.1.p1  ORF type:complete len:470 (-),score=73.88 GHVP01024779.1:236-1612(-)
MSKLHENGGTFHFHEKLSVISSPENERESTALGFSCHKWSPGNRDLIAEGNSEGQIFVASVEGNREELASERIHRTTDSSLESGSAVTNVLWCPHREFEICVTFADGRFGLLDPSTMEFTWSIQAHSNSISDLATCPIPGVYFTIAGDSTVKVWDRRMTDRIGQRDVDDSSDASAISFPLPRNAGSGRVSKIAQCVRFVDPSHTFATASAADGPIRLWDVRKGKAPFHSFGFEWEGNHLRQDSCSGRGITWLGIDANFEKLMTRQTDASISVLPARALAIDPIRNEQTFQLQTPSVMAQFLYRHKTKARPCISKDAKFVAHMSAKGDRLLVSDSKVINPQSALSPVVCLLPTDDQLRVTSMAWNPQDEGEFAFGTSKGLFTVVNMGSSELEAKPKNICGITFLEEKDFDVNIDLENKSLDDSTNNIITPRPRKGKLSKTTNLLLRIKFIIFKFKFKNF